MKKQNLTPDAILKYYWDGADEFADFCNAVLFNGEEIIHSHELAEQNAASAVILEHGEHTKSLENFRDTIKLQKITGSHDTGLALLCLESQRYISYPMPLRVMEYDGSTYDHQYHKNAEQYTGSDRLKGDEYLSSMRKTDRFLPVITIVISYNKDPWDAPTRLSELLDIPAGLEQYVNDYRYILVEARNCDLKLHNVNNIHLFNLLKIALNNRLSSREGKQKLEQYADTHRPSKKVLLTLTGVLGIKIDYRKYQKEEATMGTIFDDMFQEWENKGRNEGRAEGRAEGRTEGRAEGRAEGRTEGRAEEIISNCKSKGYSDQSTLEVLQQKLNIAATKAMEFLQEFGTQPVQN